MTHHNASLQVFEAPGGLIEQGTSVMQRTLSRS